MVVLTDGECHTPEKQGCITKFHVSDLYMAFFMISFDSCLFFWFCRKWYGIIKILQLCGEKVPMDLIQTASIQFILTIIAMISCVFDAIMHLILNKYQHTMIFYLMDIMIIATCNFGMIKEIQERIFICLCHCFKDTKFVKNFERRGQSFTIGQDKDGNKIKTTEDKIHIHPMSVDKSKDRKLIKIEENKVSMDINHHHDQVKDETDGYQTDTTHTSKRREIVSDSAKKGEITPRPSVIMCSTNNMMKPDDSVITEMDESVLKMKDNYSIDSEIQQIPEPDD